MKKQTIKNIFQIAILVVYAVAAVLLFTFKLNIKEEEYLLGTTLLVTCVLELCSFFIFNKHKEKINLNIPVFGMIGLVIGALFIADVSNKELLTISGVCITWAIYEIAKDAVEIYKCSFEVVEKKEWLALVEIAMAIVEIVFDILLVIEKEEHLNAHLTVLAVSFIVIIIVQILKMIKSTKEQA